MLYIQTTVGFDCNGCNVFVNAHPFAAIGLCGVVAAAARPAHTCRCNNAFCESALAHSIKLDSVSPATADAELYTEFKPWQPALGLLL